MSTTLLRSLKVTLEDLTGLFKTLDAPLDGILQLELREALSRLLFAQDKLDEMVQNRIK